MADLDETYDWGVEELARMVAEQETIADQIKSGASVEEAIAFLEEDASPTGAATSMALASA